MKKEILKSFRNHLISKDKLKSIKGGYVSEGGVCTVTTNTANSITITTYWSDGSCCSPGAGSALVSSYDGVGNYAGSTYISSASAAASHADCS